MTVGELSRGVRLVVKIGMEHPLQLTIIRWVPIGYGQNNPIAYNHNIPWKLVLISDHAMMF